jgi:hypothetical protein
MAFLQRIGREQHYPPGVKKQMKHPSRHLGLLAFALLIISAAPGQEKTQSDLKGEVETLRATIAQLQTEVAQLRQGLAKLELERRRDVIRQMKSELDTLRAEHARLAELDRARQQDLRDIEEVLSRPDIAAGERMEMEASRSELAVARSREIDHQAEAARVRESELVRRLETEEQLAKRLEEAWKLSGGKT